MRATIAFLTAMAVTAFPAVTTAQTARPASAGNETTLVITAQGSVSRPPDVATINAMIVTSDDVAQTATSRNNEIYAAVGTRLSALGIDAGNIKSGYYNVSYNPRPSPPPSNAGPAVAPYPGSRFGYVVNRSLIITVTNVAQTGAVVDALVAAGATGVSGVSYGLSNRKAATDEALAAAMADAASQAKAVANAAHMRITGIKQIQVGNSYGGAVPAPPPIPMTRAVTTSLPPTNVDVRTNVTVTYLLRP